MTEQTTNVADEQISGVDLVRAIGDRQPPAIFASTYQRTREMTLDELMLENRIIFLIGEINQASAARVTMQMLYLEDQNRGQQINLSFSCLDIFRQFSELLLLCCLHRLRPSLHLSLQLINFIFRGSCS